MSTQSDDEAATVKFKTGWWYASDGKRNGPISTEELCRLLIAGTITPKSLIWKQGMEGWQQVRELKSLAPLLASLPPELPSSEQLEKASRAALEQHSGSQKSAEPSARGPASIPAPQARSGRRSLRELTARRERETADTNLQTSAEPSARARNAIPNIRTEASILWVCALAVACLVWAWSTHHAAYGWANIGVIIGMTAPIFVSTGVISLVVYLLTKSGRSALWTWTALIGVVSFCLSIGMIYGLANPVAQ